MLRFLVTQMDCGTIYKKGEFVIAVILPVLSHHVTVSFQMNLNETFGKVMDNFSSKLIMDEELISQLKIFDFLFYSMY